MLDVGRHFLEIKQNNLTTLKKTTDNIKNLEKLIFTVSLLILRTSDETGGDINRCAFLISPWDEIRQHLKDLHNSTNQYFSNAKCTMSPNHVPLPRMQARRTIDFKVMVDLKLLWLQIALCNSPLRNQACQETEAHHYLKEPVQSSLVHVHI